jgi:hypothetical protein
VQDPYAEVLAQIAENQLLIQQQQAAEQARQAQIQQQLQQQQQMQIQMQLQMEREAEARRQGQFRNMLMQQTDLTGQRVDVSTPDPFELEYLYDFSSIFATPEQEKLFGQPFAEGGQVNDLTDTILRILGEK